MSRSKMKNITQRSLEQKKNSRSTKKRKQKKDDIK